MFRHQADALHAYHLVANVHKIPKERILLFMYDDIAWDVSNPIKGNIINYPNGENLYTDDIEKDYTKEEVTPENFIGALTKDPQLIAKGKKIVNSTSEDRVFIYFTGKLMLLKFRIQIKILSSFLDHGAPGMLSFPNAILSAKKFNNALNVMQQLNSFNKMLIYIEACESGSMFHSDKLNPQKNIYALTASSFNEPSYATFWDQERKTYLADEFSINWIMDSYELDSENQEETIFKQFMSVKKRTKDSTVCEFGDLEMAKQYDTSAFQGKTDNETNVINVRKLISDVPRQPIRNDEVEYYLTKIYSDLNKDDSFDRLIKGRRLMNQFMNSLRTKFADKIKVEKSRLTGRNEMKDIDCYDDVLNYFNDNCISLHVHTYLYRHLYLFVNACNEIKKQNSNFKANDLNEIINQHCSPMKNTFVRMDKVI